VREDVAADEHRDHDHRDHRDECRAVALDLIADAQAALVESVESSLTSRTFNPREEAHRPAHPVPSAGPCDSGPLKLGSACL